MARRPDPGSNPANTGEGPLQALERELTLLARHHLPSARRHAELALDRSAYQILSRLESGPMTLAELAAAFGLDISTVNRQVSALLRQEYVERIVDPTGGVARPVRPTGKGLGALRRDRKAINERLERVTEEWTPHQIARLAKDLRRFNESIEGRDGVAWPRP